VIALECRTTLTLPANHLHKELGENLNGLDVEWRREESQQEGEETVEGGLGDLGV
jgi:hypothetical protein